MGSECMKDSKLPSSHAEVQRKYCEKNPEATRVKVRKRMQRTPEEVEKAGQQHKEGDVDYRESKFIEKYSKSNFFDDLDAGNMGGDALTDFCHYARALLRRVAVQLAITSITPLFPTTSFSSTITMDGHGHSGCIHISNTRAQASQAWARHCRHQCRSATCHETEEPAVHPSDADSDTDEPRARARVLDRTARQHAKTCVKNPKTTVQVVKCEVSVKSEWSPLRAMSVPVKRTPVSTSRAALVPVKHAATPKAEPASPKKLSLYADMEDSDEDVFKSDSSMEVPLASLATSRRDSRATSVLSSLAHLKIPPLLDNY
ncbi:hypothetical protein K438DRAFT_1775144 [Mycena galopus ATCC 62051]|nr:hypothetical protein K438DRAFT_1775144 [Mycena galopus ATCC 62051]